MKSRQNTLTIHLDCRRRRRDRLVMLRLPLSVILVTAGVSSLGAEPSSFHQEMPLGQFVEPDEVLRLRPHRSDAVVYLPISTRVEMERVTLHLEFTNSVSLLEDRSQLIVSLNGGILRQFRLSPDRPTVVEDIPLPPDLIRHGYNQLRFHAVQHYANQCEDGTAHELWTQIDLNASSVRLEGRMRPVETKFSELSSLFDRRLWGSYEIDLVTATADLEDIHLRWGSLISQGASLLLDYVPLKVHWVPRFLRDQSAARDAVLFGTKAELAPILGPARTDRITGPYLALSPLGDEGTRFLLVVSGTDEADVTLAATAFAFLDFPFPDASEIEITDVEVSPIASYSAHASLREGQKYDFAELGLETISFHGLSSKPAELTVWLPPDLFSPGPEQVELILHLAYGAALRSDSVLNITLNGRFENAIFLDDPRGGVFWDYRIKIPLRSFKAGKNLIEFEPHMMPWVSAECAPIQEGNLRLTLFDDSTLSLPDATHLVSMPDLSLLSRTGFPYVTDAEGSSLSLRLLSREPGAVESAWMLLGKLAQIVTFPLLDSRVSFGPMNDYRNLLIVGTEEQLDLELLASAPLQLGELTRVPHPIVEQPRSVATDSGPVMKWTERVWAKESDGRTIGPTARVSHSGGLGRYRALYQFESPDRDGATITVFAAASSDDLSRGMSHLVEPSFWSHLAGDLVLWMDTPDSIRSQQAGPLYQAGDRSPIARTSHLFSHRPLVWFVGLLASVAVLSITGRHLLQQYRGKHQPYLEENA
ncbi:MAG TPA: cellulose biosynthesis cyclic di-GMP-binding regulatory protein BcsB [Vicinamibacteria bacterium]|nr:cellulose biosynthesis cyclic di-GMP-binding regulatory protein BcsB [Vicinamibacteria bacterium]